MFKNINPSALGVSGHQSEIIELALTFGFAGIDLAVTDFATRVKLKGMPYARRLFDSARLRLGTFQLPFEVDAEEGVYNKEMEKLPGYAQVAAEAGCTRCVTTLSPAGDVRPYHENFEFHRRRLKEICTALQESGVSLGVGFRAPEYLRKGQAFQFIHDFDALTLLLNMVDATNLGVLLDVWELVACGRPIDTIRKIPAKQIIAVQVADMAADVPLSALNEDSRLLPGADGGQVDVAGALMALSELGYQGPVTPKPSRSILQTRKREVAVRQTAEAMDKVWRAAGLSSSASHPRAVAIET